MEYDLHHSVDNQQGMTLKTITGNGITNGALVDTAVFGSLEFVISGHTLASTGGTHTVTIQESDVDPFDGSATTLPADQQLGPDLVFTDSEANKTARMGSIGKKRYQRIQITTAGYVSGTVQFSAVAVLGNPKVKPTDEVFD